MKDFEFSNLEKIFPEYKKENKFEAKKSIFWEIVE